MSTLIDVPRAIQNATLAALNTSNSAYLTSLICAASETVRRICKREFTLTAYSEYYSGGYYNDSPLSLRQFPVTAITRVAADPQAAILIQNISTANQRATVATTSTGIALTRVASGVTSTDNVTYTANVTLNAVATAIGNLGNGWSATVQGNFGLWPSADLKPLQGALNALNGGQCLEIYAEDVQCLGSIAGDPSYNNFGWRLDDELGVLYGVLPRGSLNIRIDYTAGYATIPQDVQEACVQIILAMYQQGLVNQAVKSERIGEYDYTLKDGGIPRSALALLDPFVAHDRVIGR